MAIKRHLIHINNHTLTEGVPVAPQANDLMHGEIAVNYGEGGETLFIKNDKENANEIVKFSSDKYWQEKSNAKADRCEITPYIVQGGQMPFSDVYTYNGIPLKFGTQSEYKPDWEQTLVLYIDTADMDESVTYYYVFENYGSQDVWNYVATYTQDNVPPIIKGTAYSNPLIEDIRDDVEANATNITNLADTVESNELTTSAALNDLNARLAIIEQALDLDNKTIEYGTITVDGQTKNVILWS